ncbi:hypothetical protein, partial [Jeotgalibaca porci]
MLNIENYAIWNIFGIDIWITETIVNTWIIMLVLTLIALYTRSKLKKFKEIPAGFQNAIEAVIEMFDNFITNTLGKKL